MRGLSSVSKTAALAQPELLTTMSLLPENKGQAFALDLVFDEMVGNTVVWRKVLRTASITFR